MDEKDEDREVDKVLQALTEILNFTEMFYSFFVQNL